MPNQQLIWDWIMDNLIAELIFGVIFIPLIWQVFKFFRDYFRAKKIEHILSIHNNPSRVWRKGIYARDRFMQIYEAKVPLKSDKTLLYGGGDAGAAWWTEYIDKYILERYGLVTVFEEGNQKKAKINKNRITNMVYKRIKRKENYKKKLLEKYHRER